MLSFNDAIPQWQLFTLFNDDDDDDDGDHDQIHHHQICSITEDVNLKCFHNGWFDWPKVAHHCDGILCLQQKNFREACYAI